MKILLINPKNSDNLLNHSDILPFINKKAFQPPLGLLTVAAILPSEWQKKLVDLNVKKLKDSDIRWADYVFLGGMYGQQESMNEIAMMSKALGTKIVIGGPFLSKFLDFKGSFLKNYEGLWQADHFVLDEAERTLPRFIKDLESGKPRHVYRSLEQTDLALSPFPLWDLIDCDDYCTMLIQFSKGCPNRCDFCDVPSLYAHKEPQQLIKELYGLHERGWRGHIFFADDNFTLNKHLLKEQLLPEMKQMIEELDHPFSFSCEAAMDLADDSELMHLLAETGFTTVFLGIETTNIESLKECNKTKNIGRDLLESVKKIQRAGLLVNAGFIIGFDHDTESTADNIVTFAQESGIVLLIVNVLYASPGTELYKRLEIDKRLHPKIDFNFLEGETNFEPVMGYGNVKRAFKKIGSELLRPKNFHYRIVRCFEDYQYVKKKKMAWSLYKICVLLKIVVSLGFCNQRSKIYRKMFLDLFSKHPERLELIISFLMAWHGTLNLFASKWEIPYSFD